MNATKLSNLIQTIRDEDFTFVGLCEDESVRIGCKGERCLQLPKGHVAYINLLNLAKIEDPEAFESAVMGWLYAK